MDHNVIIFTIVTFALMIVMVRFMLAMLVPALVILAVAALLYAAFGRGRAAVPGSSGTATEPELRVDGLTMKYSQAMVEIVRNAESLRTAFAGDRVMAPVVNDLSSNFDRLSAETLTLCKKASQIEQFLSTTSLGSLQSQERECRRKYDAERDPDLRAEYQKNLAMLAEAIATFTHGEKLVKMVDMEVERVRSYFDIARMKIASLLMSNNVSAEAEVETISKEIKALQDGLKKLRDNFSDVNIRSSI